MNSACTALQPLDVSHRISHDNLHVTISSRFDLPQATALIHLLEQYHRTCKRIFIDVRQIKEPYPLAAAELKAAFKKSACQPSQILFKGRCGFDLAVSGHRVLVVSPKACKSHGHVGMSHEEHEHHHEKGHVCKNNCPNCKCKNKK